MNLAPTEDQLALAAAMDATVDGPPASWRWEAYAAWGWLGLGLPTAVGGAGLGPVEEALLFRRIGRRLVPGPVRSSVLAAHACLEAGRSDLAAELVSGARRCGSTVGGISVDVGPDDLAISLDGDQVAILEGFDLKPTDGVELAASTAVLTGGTTVLEIDAPTVVARARLLVAAEALGVIDAVCEMSARYARDRVQFGVPIGSFQAVKHRCADMAVSAYAIGAQIAFAAHRLAAGSSDRGFHCAAAHLLATTAAPRATADNIQNHGAIGFTMEHPAHLYLRRAHTLEWVLGPTMDCARAVLAPVRHEFE